MKNDSKDTLRIFMYLAIVFGVYYTLWLVACVLSEDGGKTVFSILQFPLVFMGTPALAVFITRKFTKDKTKLSFNLKIWKNKRALLFSAIIPTMAVFVGAVIFFFIFPRDLDLSATYISENFADFGAPSDIQLTVPLLLAIGLIICVISSICVPSWFAALGEDIGWQGYLLPLLCKKMPIKTAVILTGALWGLGHAPLIYSGMNYGLNYAGAPYGGIIMMILFCITVGIWMSYLTIKTNNCMYAAVIHGAVNIIGEAPVFVSLSTRSTLLGPSPAGIIGMSVLLIGAVFLIFKMPEVQCG